MRTAAIAGVAVALAFAIRVIPAYPVVMSPGGVNFLDDDSWFHMRSVHNLAAHFPLQSGFDPYAIFPGGQILYTEPWDLTLAGVAWLSGAGKPSAHLIDLVGAWMPALVGALMPIPIFLLGRRLFGEMAGALSALAVAVIPGTYLWETHLGVPDHHVAECLLAVISLTCLCSAVEQEKPLRARRAIASGVALGIFLLIRPAGIFVPGTFAIAALLETALAPLALTAIGIASLFFLTSSGNKWALHTWLALGICSVVCIAAWLLGQQWDRRGWRRAFLFPAVAVAAVCLAGAVAAARPEAFFTVTANIARFLPGGHDVFVNTIAELMPLWTYPPRHFAALMENLGGMWIVGIPFLAGCIVMAWKERRPALTLFTVWAVVMTAGGFIQLRMLIYCAPVMALCAGAGADWLMGLLRGRGERFRQAATAGFAFLLFASSVPAGVRQLEVKGGLNSDWWAALTWLRQNTPEPMHDKAAWSGYWPRLKGSKFAYPPGAWGVLSWWDYGDQINAVAHRIPNANGTQVHADYIASFLLATDPERARERLGRLGTRYLMLNSEVMTIDWPGMILWADDDAARFKKRLFAVGAGGQGQPLTIYQPDFYRSMAARLYIFDGRQVPAPPAVSVFTTRREKADSGNEFDVLIARREFASEKQAWDYMSANTGETMVLGSDDPTKSCVELEAVPWADRVFTSDASAMSLSKTPKAVKIFEVIR